MFRNIASAAIYVAVLVFLTAALARSADYGTAEEARVTLDKAVAAVKADKAKALDMFNKGEGGFKDRDLYVFCANASDGVMTAHPTHKGEQLADIKGKKGFPFGQEMMKNATEGKVSEVTYWWPRPGSDKPLEKTSFYTRSETRFAASATTSEQVHGCAIADSLVMTCLRSLGPTEISPVNGRL